MLKKAVLIILAMSLLIHILCIFSDAEAQAQATPSNKKPSAFAKAWESFKKHTFAFSIATVTVITIITSIMQMAKKDKLLKSISGHLITIELTDNSRYRGRLRVEPEGVEVVSEKADEGNKKVSFILRTDEMDRLHALVRYHDLLTDKEKEQRNEEVRRVYHPSIGMRFKRKVRNIVNEMRRVVTEAFTLIFSRAKTQFQTYGAELETAGKEVIGYVTEAAYDSLIDRLIGTKVIVRTTSNQEYGGVFKDYTSSFIAFLDVSYKSNWAVTTERDYNFSKHERGLNFQRNGDNAIISSKGPFRITLRSMLWTGDQPDIARGDANTTLVVIEPFGQVTVSLVPPQVDRVVDPFEKLQVPIQYAPNSYKKIAFSFESVRVADVVMLKKYGIIRHRTEKYEPKLLDISTIKDSLLVSKEEGFILKGNPSATPMIIHNGHLTNLPRERMDAREVDDQISQRWAVDSYFGVLDRKIRPVVKFSFFGEIPSRRTKRLISIFALMSLIHSDENWRRTPFLFLMYSSLYYVSAKKKARIIRRQARAKSSRTKFVEFFKKLRPRLIRQKPQEAAQV